MLGAFCEFFTSSVLARNLRVRFIPRPEGRNDLDIILVVTGPDMLRMLWVDMAEVSAYVRCK